MWTVVKIKRKELNIFKKKIAEKLGKDIKFYCPKIEHHNYFRNKLKRFDKLVLENYMFCYHKKFSEPNSCFSELKFLKGLEYFLKGYEQNQAEIVKFINHCKSFENKEGYLTADFFKAIITKKAKFTSGPFTSMMFEIIERQKKKLKILIGGIVTTISDNKNHSYRPI